jgi:hypothetical protein
MSTHQRAALSGTLIAFIAIFTFVARSQFERISATFLPFCLFALCPRKSSTAMSGARTSEKP